MALVPNELPASSQLSSLLSDPPDSDNEELGEITVDLNSTTISPSRPQTSPTATSTPTPTPTPSKSRSKPSPKKTASLYVPPAKRQPLRQNRNKPVRYMDASDDELGEEKEAPVSSCASKDRIPAKRNRADSITKPPSKPTPKPAVKRAKPTLIRGARRWEPDFVTQSTKSPLVTNNIDLRSLLLQPAAWDVLSAEDRDEILALMPSEKHIMDPNTATARPNIGSLLNNDTFRHDTEVYVTNMSNGMHDRDWLKDAWAAHQRRAIGDFDRFYLRKIEVDWSADIPNEHRPEHLRSDNASGLSTSEDDDHKDVTMSDPPELAKGALEQNGVSVKNEVSEQNGAVKVEDLNPKKRTPKNPTTTNVAKTQQAEDLTPKKRTPKNPTPTNGAKTQPAKRKASIASISGSTTSSPAKTPKKTYEVSRFALIEDDEMANNNNNNKVQVDKATNHKGTTNGTANDTTNGTANGTTNGKSALGGKAPKRKIADTQDHDAEASGGEITVRG